MEKELREQLNHIIETRDLYGRSFTRGVALKMGIMEDLFTRELLFDIAECIEMEEFYKNLEDLLKDHNYVRLTLRALMEMMDIALIDEIARWLLGEGEEA